jgi:bifunctional UDP-N-acetylglucosamine pyrophosphorylase/glucosamine-1-phosphate N-acetyltransferase
MKPLAVLIMAAGQGTRMKSKTAKVLHPVLGWPMIRHVVDTARQLEAERIVLVVGNQAEDVISALADTDCEFVVQQKRKGTAHAVMQAEGLLGNFGGNILILSGDSPLTTVDTLKKLINSAAEHGAMFTMTPKKPFGYGRVINNPDGSIAYMVEERDATQEQKNIPLVGAGTYCLDAAKLFEALKGVGCDNDQGEYYLPDIIPIMGEAGYKIFPYHLEDEWEAMGINDRAQLACAEKILQEQINLYWMREGVTLIQPETIRIEKGVRVGRDTVIYPGCFLEGDTTIGEDCRVGPYAKIIDSSIGEEAEIRLSCLIDQAQVADGARVGPFAHLRPGAEIGAGAIVGNFVEVKKSVVGEGSKVCHLSYVGDAEVAENVNVGAGTITCNYDGKKKHKTVIEKGVLIGSGSQLVAPITIGENAVVGAGATVRKDVPSNSLAYSEHPQKNIENWKGSKDEE